MQTPISDLPVFVKGSSWLNELRKEAFGVSAMISRIGILICILMLTACATISSLKPGEGIVFQVDGTSYDEVWNAAITALSENNLDLKEANKETGILKASSSVRLDSWGEVVGIFVTKKSAAIGIEVLSLRRGKLNITARNWENVLIEGIKRNLATRHP